MAQVVSNSLEWVTYQQLSCQNDMGQLQRDSCCFKLVIFYSLEERKRKLNDQQPGCWHKDNKRGLLWWWNSDQQEMNIRYTIKDMKNVGSYFKLAARRWQKCSCLYFSIATGLPAEWQIKQSWSLDEISVACPPTLSMNLAAETKFFIMSNNCKYGSHVATQ